MVSLKIITHGVVYIYMYICVCELHQGTWMCGESWLATKDLKPTIPVLTLGIKVSHATCIHDMYIVHVYNYVCLGYVGWVILVFFSSCFCSVCSIFTCMLRPDSKPGQRSQSGPDYLLQIPCPIHNPALL